MSDPSHPDGVRRPDPTLGRRPQLPEPFATAPLHGPAESVGGVETETTDNETRQRPRRQRVVLSDPRQRTNVLRTSVELAEQSSWGELLIKDLVRRQLRTALVLVALVGAVLVGLPLAFHLAPAFSTLRVLGVPLAWVLVAIAPFPLLLIVGLAYSRRAERNERDFVDMIDK